MDIVYINAMSTFMILISILDGDSRMIVHHELQGEVMEHGVEISIQ